MKNFPRKFGIILVSASLIFAQNAFAARMGKSRSMGMQRSTATQSTGNNSFNNSNYRSNNQANNQQPQANNGGGSRVGGVVAGVAAGAVGGYLLGKAMNSNNGQKASSSQALAEQAQTAAAKNESHIPWGIIGILALLLIIGLMIFRRKAMPQSANQNPYQQQAGANNSNNFEIPNIRRDNSNYSANNNQGRNQTTQAAQPTINPLMEKMSDGIEVQYFLRQVKGMFLHIQSMNTPDNVFEVAKYMTPELYNELKSLVATNDFVADFPQLDCQLVGSSEENGSYIASVKFFGKVSDSPDAPVVDFAEQWNFIKPVNIDNAKWIVAGIQQINSSN